MNVDDIEVVIPNQFHNEMDRLDHIFSRQLQLALKYETIEIKNELLFPQLVPKEGDTDCPYPYNIDDRFAQARIKDFCWRVTEELMEMCEPISDTHFLEELSDALHFMVELLIICGIKSDDIIGRSFHEQCRLDLFWKRRDHELLGTYQKPIHRNYDQHDVMRILQPLGLAANCLKQKPWKQTHQLTDIDRFKGYMKQSFLSMLTFARLTGITADEFFRMYYKKSEVNNFRIRSNY